MKQEKVDYCFAVTSFALLNQRENKITAANRIEIFHLEHFETRSQDLAEFYHDAGQLSRGKVEAFKQQKPPFLKSVTPYILPRHFVQDVDTPEDWKRAELIY